MNPTRPNPALGYDPHSVLYGHVGNAPTSSRTRMIIRMVPIESASLCTCHETLDLASRKYRSIAMPPSRDDPLRKETLKGNGIMHHKVAIYDRASFRLAVLIGPTMRVVVVGRMRCLSELPK